MLNTNMSPIKLVIPQVQLIVVGTIEMKEVVLIAFNTYPLCT